MKKLSPAIWLLMAFALWTLGVCFIDVLPIGPQGTAVGFAFLNSLCHRITGVHMVLYHITDWLGLVPFVFVSGFGLVGLTQWIRRKSFMKVDRSLLVLGAFYIAVMAAYMLFEIITINYRPVLIDGNLETSYPSSTTMLVLCVMPTAILQFNARISNQRIKLIVALVLTLFTAFMVIGRLISGVHWFSDIIGGILLSAGLVALYRSAI